MPSVGTAASSSSSGVRAEDRLARSSARPSSAGTLAPSVSAAVSVSSVAGSSVASAVVGAPSAGLASPDSAGEPRSVVASSDGDASDTASLSRVRASSIWATCSGVSAAAPSPVRNWARTSTSPAASTVAGSAVAGAATVPRDTGATAAPDVGVPAGAASVASVVADGAAPSAKAAAAVLAVSATAATAAPVPSVRRRRGAAEPVPCVPRRAAETRAAGNEARRAVWRPI